MRKIPLKNKYEGLTMIEMLITLIIVGIILVVVSATLVALIKASAISSARTLSRDESEFMLELLEKEVANSRSDDIHLFEVDHNTVSVNEDGQVIGPSATWTPRMLHSTDTANEIHYRPVNSPDWICVGYYKGFDKQGKPTGYLLKKTLNTEYDNVDCFTQDEGTGHVFLNSEEINVDNFVIRSYKTSDENITFLIDLVVKPVYWVPGNQSAYKPEYARQLVVSTEKLTF